MVFWTRPSICVVTGASRGYGREISILFADKLPKGSTLLLLARDLNGLDETATRIRARRADVRVAISACDLSTADSETYENIFAQIAPVAMDGLKQAILVHNAGSLGDISRKVVEHKMANDLAAYWKLNLTSPLLITSAFDKHFGGVPHKYLVQISSLCAVQPYKTWSLYCAGKAARDMLFETMATEEADWRVLNYAPGTMETDMVKQAKAETGDPEYKASLNELAAGGKGMMTCEASVTKLMALLEKDVFQTGSHVDIYQVEDDGRVDNKKDYNVHYAGLAKK